MNRGDLGFGDFLLVMAERLDHQPDRRDAVLDCLHQIDEAFGRALDPATDFEAYAAVRLCRSIREALHAQQPESYQRSGESTGEAMASTGGNACAPSCPQSTLRP